MIVETSLNVTTNSPSQDYTHADDHTSPTYGVTPGLKPLGKIKTGISKHKLKVRKSVLFFFFLPFFWYFGGVAVVIRDNAPPPAQSSCMSKYDCNCHCLRHLLFVVTYLHVWQPYTYACVHGSVVSQITTQFRGSERAAFRLLFS